MTTREVGRAIRRIERIVTHGRHFAGAPCPPSSPVAPQQQTVLAQALDPTRFARLGQQGFEPESACHEATASKPAEHATRSASRSASSDAAEGISPSWLAHLNHMRETVESLARARHLSYQATGAIVVGLITAGGLAALNWRDIQRSFSRESAEVVSLTIKDEQLQFEAGKFSKELIQRVLNDEEVAKVAAAWVLRLLTSIQDDIGMLFVKILALDPVVEAVNRLADKLVAYLCTSEVIQERVGRLLVDAICLEYSRDAAAKWAYELVMREDVTSGFRDLVVAALQTDEVVQQSQVVGAQIVDYVLKDPAIFLEARRTLTEAMRDDELKAAAKESLWNIVLPWGSRAAQEKHKERIADRIKALDELASLDCLSPEERLTLRTLQAKLSSQQQGVSKNGSKNGSAVPVAPPAPPVAQPPGPSPPVSPSEVPPQVPPQVPPPAAPPAPLAEVAPAAPPAEAVVVPAPAAPAEVVTAPAVGAAPQVPEPAIVVEPLVGGEKPVQETSPSIPRAQPTQPEGAEELPVSAVKLPAVPLPETEETSGSRSTAPPTQPCVAEELPPAVEKPAAMPMTSEKCP